MSLKKMSVYYNQQVQNTPSIPSVPSIPSIPSAQNPHSVGNEAPDGDLITQLPIDQQQPTPHEVQIIDTLFKKHKGTMDVMFEEAKDSIIVALVIILFCLPQVDATIQKLLPITHKSPYILMLIKALAAGVLFWLLKHFYLSRK
jgi:uncharacterized integral membrane protein